jgi:hypothetical protein
MSDQKDILIIPTYSRPEMLWICLERIARCPDAAKLDIRVCVDSHEGFQSPIQDIATVVAKFPTLQIDIIIRPTHNYSGNSYNVLTAYREAYETDAKYVFMVEDDIMVSKDFFEWHYYIQKLFPDCFCSIGTMNQRHSAPNADVENGYYKNYMDYASWGVCFERGILSHIIRHAIPDYFSHMEYYIRRHLFGFGFDNEYCEQDGLILRVMGLNRCFSVYPITAHAQHVGWYGYHRRKSIRPVGLLEERYEYVKRVISDSEELKNHVRDFYDIEALAG